MATRAKTDERHRLEGHIPSRDLVFPGPNSAADANTSLALSPIDHMVDHEWIELFVNLLGNSLS